MNNLKVDGQELQARSSTATAKYVEAFKAEKAMKGPEDKEEGEHVETEEQKDAKLMEQIQKVLDDREEGKHKEKDDPSGAATTAGALGASASKDQESETNSLPSKDVGNDAREKRQQRPRRGSPESRSGRALSRERRELETIIRDEESAYRKRLQEWESYER